MYKRVHNLFSSSYRQFQSQLKPGFSNFINPLFTTYLADSIFDILKPPYMVTLYPTKQQFSQGKLVREERLRSEPVCLLAAVFPFLFQQLIKPAFKIQSTKCCMCFCFKNLNKYLL